MALKTISLQCKSLSFGHDSSRGTISHCPKNTDCLIKPVTHQSAGRAGSQFGLLCMLSKMIPVVCTPFFTMRAATEYWVESFAAPLPFDFQASSRMEIICFLSSMVIWVSVSSPAFCTEIQVEIQIVKRTLPDNPKF